MTAYFTIELTDFFIFFFKAPVPARACEPCYVLHEHVTGFEGRLSSFPVLLLSRADSPWPFLKLDSIKATQAFCLPPIECP